MQKRTKLVSFVALAIVVICLGILAIPGFAKLTSNTATFSGYETIFHYANRPDIKLDGNAIKAVIPGSKAMGIDIAALVFIAFALVSYAFSGKSTVLPVVGGAFSVLASIIFFSNALWIKTAYNKSNLITLSWSTYVVGGLLIVAGIATLFYGIKDLIAEKNTLSSKQGYSYLKNK